jgi:type II secretory pathway pseudopilin PulG
MPGVKAARGESGFTFVEVMVASLIAMVVLSMVALSSVTITRNSVGAIQRGSSTGPALLAVQEVQQVLSRAWTPNTSSNITSYCAGGDDGQSFATGNGPFVPLAETSPVSTTDVMFCAVDPTSPTTAHTYELHFTNSPGGSDCDASSQCILELDQEPAYNCSGSCTPRLVWSTSGISDSGSPSTGPFTYYESRSTAFTTPVLPSNVTLGQIEAVQVTLAVSNPAPGGSSSESVQRMILLPNTLPNGGS